MDYKARFYSPKLMRFTQLDTKNPQLRNPQECNRCAYDNNSPVMFNDPDGHTGKCPDRLIYRKPNQNQERLAWTLNQWRLRILAGLILQAENATTEKEKIEKYQEAIDYAVEYFMPVDDDRVTGKPTYDPDLEAAGEYNAETGEMTIGTLAFDSSNPGNLIVTIYHENIHTEQLAEGRAYRLPMGKALNEVEAYSKALEFAEENPDLRISPDFVEGLKKTFIGGDGCPRLIGLWWYLFA